MRGVNEQTVANEDLTPLSSVESGRLVRLVSIDAGRDLKSRLADMGLVPGMELRVIRNSSRGPFIVAVKESRVALGRGMVHKMLVK